MNTDLTSTLRLTIDSDAIARNFQHLKKLSGPARCGAAVKANAYGCGIKTVVPVLSKAGCKDFFVADALEGAKLRRIVPQANIYVLNGVFDETLSTIFENNLIPAINSLFQINLWQNTGSTSPYALQIDTGMNRLGLLAKEAIDTIDNLRSKPKLIMSHFANADDPQDLKNTTQLNAFLKLTQKYTEIKASMANSAATLSNPNALFDLTRPGIGLYGGNPFTNIKNPMQTVMQAETRIIDIRNVSAGETISYGGTYIAEKPMRIAVCGVGYADGYPRGASGHGIPLRTTNSNGAQAFIDGHKINCVGRITMDLTMYDISEIPADDIKIGDWVELFGHHIKVDEIAQRSGTVSYEILACMGRRHGTST